MTTTERTVENVKQATRQARRELEKQVDQAVTKQHAELAAALVKQQKELQGLQTEITALKKVRGRSSGGGFPWGLVLLVGGGYALYRSNSTVRQQIDGLIQRVNPGPEGNLARAGDAAKAAVSDVMQGESPKTSIQAAGGELQRGAEKAVDDLKDRQ